MVSGFTFFSLSLLFLSGVCSAQATYNAAKFVNPRTSFQNGPMVVDGNPATVAQVWRVPGFNYNSIQLELRPDEWGLPAQVSGFCVHFSNPSPGTATIEYWVRNAAAAPPANNPYKVAEQVTGAAASYCINFAPTRATHVGVAFILHASVGSLWLAEVEVLALQGPRHLDQLGYGWFATPASARSPQVFDMSVDVHPFDYLAIMLGEVGPGGFTSPLIPGPEWMGALQLNPTRQFVVDAWVIMSTIPDWRVTIPFLYDPNLRGATLQLQGVVMNLGGIGGLIALPTRVVTYVI